MVIFPYFVSYLLMPANFGNASKTILNLPTNPVGEGMFVRNFKDSLDFFIFQSVIKMP